MVETLKKLKNLEIEDPDLTAAIQTVHGCAKPILSPPIHLHYTDHSIEHSKRILGYINKLIPEDCLSEKEKFILTCAVLLHDIGMQYTEKKIPIEDITILEEIRKNHHEISANIITLNSSVLGFSSLTTSYIPHISLVAKSHGWEHKDIELVEDKDIESETINMKLLCLLIRLGDCLDVHRKRVVLERLDFYDIPIKSKLHWYAHYYVAALTIRDKKTSITFNFPEEYKKEDSKIIVDFITNHIQDSIKQNIFDISQSLIDFGISIKSELKITTDYVSDVKKMPNDLVKYIQEAQKATFAATDGGLGEIEFYWGGDREDANKEIIKYLEQSDSSEIFISAIGFGTISNVLQNEKVIEKIKNKILDDKIKITFVLPGSLRELFNFRQDIKEEILIKSYENGKMLLNKFRDDLSKCCFPYQRKKERTKKIAKYIEIKRYVGSVPRHFILYGSDGTIFFGAYLGHTTGKRSYIMKLKSNEETKSENIISGLNKGLFTLFKKEIDDIENRSIEIETE